MLPYVKDGMLCVLFVGYHNFIDVVVTFFIILLVFLNLRIYFVNPRPEIFNFCVDFDHYPLVLFILFVFQKDNAVTQLTI